MRFDEGYDAASVNKYDCVWDVHNSSSFTNEYVEVPNCRNADNVRVMNKFVNVLTFTFKYSSF